MTIETVISSTTQSGNGSNTIWPFNFFIPDTDSLQVIITDADANETVLNPGQYSVAGTDSVFGGNVTYPLSGQPLGVNEKLTILRVVPYTQGRKLRDQRRYDPEVVEAALDKVTMLAQQLKSITERCVKVPVSSAIAATDYLAELTGLKNQVATSASAAASSASNAASFANTASSHVNNAEDFAQLAELYANEDEDVVVDNGEFSARHWMFKAKEFAQQAAGVGSIRSNDTIHVDNTDPSNPVISANIAEKDEARAGEDNNELMTPLRTAQAIESLAPAAVPLAPIGQYIYVADDLGVEAVPVNDPDSNVRYIKLTEGLDASGEYNNELLINEQSSGSAPERQVTAEILIGPFAGRRIHLINSEESFLRPRETSGLFEQDQMQRINGVLRGISNNTGALWSGSVQNGVFQRGDYFAPNAPRLLEGQDGYELAFDSSASPNARTSSNTKGETRPKNVSVTAYLRIQ